MSLTTAWVAGESTTLAEVGKQWAKIAGMSSWRQRSDGWNASTMRAAMMKGRRLCVPSGAPLISAMKRLPALSLLCLALSTLPVSGASAAVMDSSVAEVAGLSMSERHVAIKAEAEAAIINTDAAQCTEATSAANRLPCLRPCQCSRNCRVWRLSIIGTRCRWPRQRRSPPQPPTFRCRSSVRPLTAEPAAWRSRHLQSTR